jgi:hypothetical protein
MKPNTFRSLPLYLILLPIFFVIHGYTDNFNAVPIADALLLVLMYILASLILFLLGWLLYRRPNKAAIFSFGIMNFHLFFGAIYDSLKGLFGDSFITTYKFLLSFSFVLFIIIAWYLGNTKRTMHKLGYYLTIVLSVFIVIDVGSLLTKLAAHSSRTNSPYTIACDTCQKPDIYFLVFDEYTSTAALKQTWNYDNSELDTFLAKKGFRLLPASKSNYNFTEFSIASTLNMDYLKIPDPSACTVKDYNYCFERIKSNRVCSVLNSLGYDLVNNSIFDLPQNPALVKEDFLPLKTKLITSQTFISRLKKDLYFHLVTGPLEIKWLSKDLIYTTYRSNNKVISSTLKTTTDTSARPKFVYAHVEMPHPPFYYDKDGHEKTKDQVLNDSKEIKLSSYLDYLPKTNSVIRTIINTIFQRSKRPFAIVLMGDHGFRYNQEQQDKFKNLNAVYINSGNYQGFYDSITNVNEFTVLFNNLFHASLPLKNDSCIYLMDKN